MNYIQGSESGTYYLIETVQLNWDDSKVNCENLGGVLAMAKTDEQARDIKNQLVRKFLSLIYFQRSRKSN